MNTAVISLGSNINPRENIEKAVSFISLDHELISKSDFISTKPVGYLCQPDFINGAVLIKTQADYDELNLYLKKLETRLGRVRTENKFGPRTIDLDIVVWNRRIVNDDFYERGFIKNSVLKLIPDLEL